jgi:hypothetical protein
MNAATLWGTDWYNGVIGHSYDLSAAALKRAQEAYASGQTYLGDQETVVKLRYFKTGLDAYAQMSSDQELSKNPNNILNAGKIEYLSGLLQKAADTFLSGLSEDYADAGNREMARWYLAVLRKKQSAQDQAVYDKLIAADPEEAAKISEVANLQF